jgi:DNA polymerase III subunit gamma/tau
VDKPYQVIARKYRPQTFSSVVGQEAIVTTLKNALRYKRLAHAYLFCGCRGTGKTTLARVFAKALNCSQLTEDFEPCNACPSCLDIIAGRSLDVLEIDGASNRGIDDIRQINETIGYAPSSGKYKIYIIDEVHMLTKEAFNALLKTLEEPPANVKFFFATTEPHKVLPTIISRCQRFDLNRIPFAALKQKLAWIAADLHVECEDEVFSLIADLSEGSLRDAESLLDQIICYAEHPITAAKVSETLGLMPHTSFFALDKAFEEQNLTFAFELASEIFTSGKDLSYFLDNLIEHYRSLLKLKLGVPVQFTTSKLHEQILASTALYTEEQCLYILDFLIQWQQQISKTPFKRVSLEMILLHIIRSKHRITLPSLVKRLTESRKESPATFAEEKPSASSNQTSPKPTECNVAESLVNKIKEKINAGPVIVEEQTHSQASLLLSKSQWEAAASAQENKTPTPSSPPENPGRYDTLIRFAAVELEGVVKKESN